MATPATNLKATGGLFGALQASVDWQNAGRPGSNNMLSPDYSAWGKPDERYARALEQQNMVRQSLFGAQFDKALKFAADKGAPEREAQQAMRQAANYNRLSREQWMRMEERSQSAIDPAVAAENARLNKFDDARNIANAYSTAKQSTKDLQLEQMGDLVGLSTSSARQALGLSNAAASAYQSRIGQNMQAQQMQQNANAQASSAALGAGMSVGTAVVGGVMTAAGTIAAQTGVTFGAALMSIL